MKIALIMIYVWAGVWTGAIVSRLYRDDEKYRFLGPAFWAIYWPIMLPLSVIGMAGSPCRNLTLRQR